jgi:hypothetical protein
LAPAQHSAKDTYVAEWVKSQVQQKIFFQKKAIVRQCCPYNTTEFNATSLHHLNVL